MFITDAFRYVSIQARLLSGYPRACDSFPDMGNSFFSSPKRADCLWGAVNLLFNGHWGGGGFPGNGAAWGGRWQPVFNPLPMLRKELFLHSQYAFKAPKLPICPLQRINIEPCLPLWYFFIKSFSFPWTLHEDTQSLEVKHHSFLSPAPERFELQIPTELPSGKENPIPIKQENGQAPELVWAI